MANEKRRQLAPFSRPDADIRLFQRRVTVRGRPEMVVHTYPHQVSGVFDVKELSNGASVDQATNPILSEIKVKILHFHGPSSIEHVLYAAPDSPARLKTRG